jgi:hypothetical protein
MKVLTTKGLIDFDQLRVTDVVEVGDNHRKIATEWHLDGELVKRDVTISILRPIETQAEQGVLGG